MRVETNEALVRRNRRISQYLFFGSFGVPLVGLLLINQQAANPSSENLFLGFIVPLVVLPLAYVITMVSVRMANLWVRVPRPETVIPDGLKGIGSKSVLYNYYHSPARHVLISPQGVFAMVIRFQDGQFRVEGDHWTTKRTAMGRVMSIFRLDSVGNPTQDALTAAAHVQKLLSPIVPDVTVEPVIVFIDPRAQVTLEDSPVAVVYANPKRDPSLKDYVREVGKKPHLTLTPEQIGAFEQATLPR
jgi:hypothetical protein